MGGGNIGEWLGRLQERVFIASRMTALLLLAAFPVLLWLLDRRALGIEPTTYLAGWKVIGNAAPAILVMLVLWFVTRRLLFSVLLVGALHVLLYLASAIKLDVLGSPVGLQDRYFLTSINRGSIEVLGAYAKGLPLLTWGAVAGTVMMVALLVERRWFAPRSWARWLGALVSVAVLTSLWHAGWPWSVLYTQQNVRASKEVSILGVLRSGLVSNLVYRHLEINNMPRVYDKAAFHGALGATASNAASASPRTASGEQPDIVVVMSESFIDPHILQGMGSMPELIGNVRAQLEQGRGGMMRVPTYGGGTVRTEFEVLTGMPLSAFPATEFPYADLPRRRMPGLAGVLARHGYTTLAVHGNSGSFWNRTSTYRSMGFQRFLAEPEFQKNGFRDGNWYSDESMTDIILEQMKQEPEKPKFVFAISMQAHGPYIGGREVRDQSAWESVAIPEKLQGEAAMSLHGYLYHINKADAQFGRLLRELEARGRPYVLAFFGDHLPGLPDAYSALGFSDGQIADGQPVPLVLIGGDEGTSLPKLRSPFFAWQLPERLLEMVGVDDPYFDFLRRAGRRMGETESADERKLLFDGIRTAAVMQLDGEFEGSLK